MFKVKKGKTDYENKSLRLPKNLIEEVQRIADENDVSFNNLAIQCMEYAINNMEKEDVEKPTKKSK